MPITLNYHQDTKILHVKVNGYLSIDDYKKCTNDFLNSQEYPNDTPAIWDLTEMKFDNIDMEFEKKLVEIRQHHNSVRGAARIAIISDNRLAEPLIKLFKILSTSLEQELKSFNNFYEAENWILKSTAKNHNTF